MDNNPIGPLEAVKSFFSTEERPVTQEELRALGRPGILELGPQCAKALGRSYRAPESKNQDS